MNNIDHKSKILELVTTLMTTIDKIPCHLRNKLQLYHRFVLSKIAWHFTIADIGKKWVTENIDNTVPQYVHQWLELPISSILRSLILSKSKYGMSLILPSTKFMQCQVVVRNSPKSSPNSDINALFGPAQVLVATFSMTNSIIPSKFQMPSKMIMKIILVMT